MLYQANAEEDDYGKVQHKITEMLTHLSHSQQQMARILDAKRQVTVRMAQMIHAIPDNNPEFEGVTGLWKSTSLVTKNIISYLSSIADFQDALADILSSVMKESGEGSDE